MKNSKTMVKIFGALRCYEDAKIAKILSLILRSLTSLIISRVYGNLQLFTFSFHRHLPWFLFSCTTILSWLWGKRGRILLRGCCWCWTKGKQKNKMNILYHFTTNKILPLWPSQSWTSPQPLPFVHTISWTPSVCQDLGYSEMEQSLLGLREVCRKRQISKMSCWTVW